MRHMYVRVAIYLIQPVFFYNKQIYLIVFSIVNLILGHIKTDISFCATFVTIWLIHSLELPSKLNSLHRISSYIKKQR
jgi:hypothetical protein